MSGRRQSHVLVFLKTVALSQLVDTALYRVYRHSSRQSAVSNRTGVVETLNSSDIPMAKPTASLEKIKELWNSQINDEANWSFNLKLLRAVGLFGGSIFIMRNFGELMTI